LLLGWVPLGSPIPILIPKKSIVDGRWWPYRTASRPHPQVPAWFRGSKWSQWALQFRNQHHLNVKWLWHVYEMIIYIYLKNYNRWSRWIFSSWIFRGRGLCLIKREYFVHLRHIEFGGYSRHVGEKVR
jgi:hypothetical protein